MNQQYGIFVFIGVIFLAVLFATTYLVGIKAVDGGLFGQVVVAEIAATAGLLAPSPLSIGKPPVPPPAPPNP
jgi:hypothetical protein